MRNKFLIILILFTFGMMGCVPDSSMSESDTLPWQREILLRVAAKSVELKSRLNPTDPQPNTGAWPKGKAMTISSLKMRTTIWGPPNRITISLTKNNVWDRRVRWIHEPTLQDIVDGAFSPANKDYVGVRRKNSTRPKDLGYLKKEGGSYDERHDPVRYVFPCMKPVGQIILGMDSFEGIEAPQLTQNCGDGIVRLQMNKGNASAHLECVLGMTSNIYAIRGELKDMDVPVWLRLYRHRDTSHEKYMTADGKSYTVKGAEKHKAFNGPIDPPESGQDGRYFWIRQKLPAEKTFPNGFEYVLMGVVASTDDVKLEAVEGKTGLGTPPPSVEIARAPGAAATATFIPGANGRLLSYVTVVTTMDGPDLMEIARKRLTSVEKQGFEAIVQENAKWWENFYDKRENGRVFYGVSGRNATDDIKTIYRSWYCTHGGGTKTDMRKYEASAHYAAPETDNQRWHSLPCYNEIFYTSRFVRNWGESVDMWKQIIEYWMKAAQDNARDMFEMPGMLIVHGYLPPVKPDKYVHTTITLEFCLGTMAQIIRPVWDEWDYGGDINFLRKVCYPMMKEMALFYAAYAKQGNDGYYHVIPSMQEECWGWYPEFSHNKDVISSLCMFRWGLSHAADAANILGVDDSLSNQWRNIAAKMAPYPTWEKSEGTIFAGIPGVEPFRYKGDHPWDACAYPTTLSDEINLDSDTTQKDMMMRTVKILKSGGTREAMCLLGVEQQKQSKPYYATEALINSRSGRIHLFPVVAPDSEVAFRNFQARGGFLISACKNVDGVYFVELTARRKGECQLMNPWPGRSVIVRDREENKTVLVKFDNSNGECLLFSTIAGHTYHVQKK